MDLAYTYMEIRNFALTSSQMAKLGCSHTQEVPNEPDNMIQLLNLLSDSYKTDILKKAEI